jgi:DNA-binding MarR family transcriptional regulator
MAPERQRTSHRHKANEAARIDAVLALFDEVVALFHHLKSAAAATHRQGEMTAGRRGILRGLARLGPQTVPQMARSRPVSRQHIQALVDDLLADGLVSRLRNPAHQRSALIDLTAAGRRAMEAMALEERSALGAARLRSSKKELEAAAATLRAVREQFMVGVGSKRQSDGPGG